MVKVMKSHCQNMLINKVIGEKDFILIGKKKNPTSTIENSNSSVQPELDGEID